MKAKDYKILKECIERGSVFGLSRAYKHNEQPEVDFVAQCIEEAVLHEICEYFDFEDLDERQ